MVQTNRCEQRLPVELADGVANQLVDILVLQQTLIPRVLHRKDVAFCVRINAKPRHFIPGRNIRLLQSKIDGRSPFVREADRGTVDYLDFHISGGQISSQLGESNHQQDKWCRPDIPARLHLSYAGIHCDLPPSGERRCSINVVAVPTQSFLRGMGFVTHFDAKLSPLQALAVQRRPIPRPSPKRGSR